jgi:hypothetical protein
MKLSAWDSMASLTIWWNGAALLDFMVILNASGNHCRRQQDHSNYAV